MAPETAFDYDKRPGTGAIAGQNYEVKMCCLMFLRGLSSGRFHLAANLNGAGAFDDIVIQLHGEGGPSQSYLVQLKHRENAGLSRSKLLSPSARNKFGLLKYFVSFRDEILPQFLDASRRHHQLFGRSLEDVTLVFYTNADISGFPDVSDHQDDLLSTSTGGGIFSFKEDRDSDVWSLPANVEDLGDISQYGTFLKRLKVYSRQASESEIDDLIKTEMCNTLNITPKSCEALFPKLLGDVQDWWKELEGSYLTERSFLWDKVVSDVLHMDRDPVSRQIAGFGIRFDDHAVRQLLSRLRNARVLLCLAQGDSTRLSLCKVAQALRAENRRFVLGHSDAALLFWQSRWCHLLVLECLDSNSELFLTLANILGRQRDKTLVVVARETDLKTRAVVANLLRAGIVEFKDEINLASLDGASQQRVTAKKVDFQGHHVPLQALINSPLTSTARTANELLGQMRTVGKIWESLEPHSEFIKVTNIQTLVKHVKDLETRRYFFQSERELKKVTQTEAMTQLQEEELKVCRGIDNFKRALQEIKTLAEVEPQFGNIHLEEEHLSDLLDRLDDLNAEHVLELADYIKQRRKLFKSSQFRMDASDVDVLLKLRADELQQEEYLKIATCSCSELEDAFERLRKELNEDIVFIDSTRHLHLLQEALNDLHQKLREDVNWLGMIFSEQNVKKLFTADLLIRVLKGESVSVGVSLEEQVPWYIRRTLKGQHSGRVYRDWELPRRAVIVAEPGMGKSSLLTEIALKIKAREPSTWVIKVNLSSMTSYLQSIDVLEQKHVLELLAKATSVTKPFDVKLLKYSLKCTGSVAVLLDGVDEVFHSHKATVKSLIQQLESVKRKVMMISARLSLRSELETLPEYETCVLEAFSEEDQRCFLREVWTERVVGVDEVHLATFIDDVLRLVSESLGDAEKSFMGLPLQTMLVAEAFESELKGGHKVGRSKARHLDVTALYEQFICKKYDSYFQQKERPAMMDQSVTLGNAWKRREIEDGHELAALVSFVPLEELGTVDNQSIRARAAQLMREYGKIWSSIGIVSITDEGETQFLHRTIQEFLVGKWLSQNFYASRRLIKTLLFTGEYAAVRCTFDRMLISGCDLHLAVLNGNMLEVRRTLSEANVNSRDRGGRTPLHIAAATSSSKGDSRELVGLLIGQGADLDVVDEVLQWSPVQYADHACNWGALEAMLERTDQPPKLFATVANKLHVLKLSCEQGYPHLVRYLVRKGTDPNAALDARGTRALHLACHCNRAEVVKSLLNAPRKYATVTKSFFRQHVNVNAKDYIGWTALHYAVMNNAIDIVKMLVEAGCKVRTRDEFNTSPTQYAVRNENLEIVRCLVGAGSQLYAFHKDTTNLLFRVAKEGMIDIVRFLIEAGCKVDLCDHAGKTMLHYASERGHFEIVQFIVKVGGNLNVADRNALSPLHYASINGNTDIARCLVKAGCITNICDCNLRTPMHYSAQKGNLDVVHILIEAGSILDVCDTEKMTPLHYASMEGHAEIVKALISAGSKTAVRDERHRSPLHYAAERGHKDIARKLMEGASVLDVGDAKKMTPLHCAVLNGHVDTVRLLIGANFNVSERDVCNMTCVDYAVKGNHLDILSLLTKAGGTLDRDKECTMSLIFKAVEQGCLETVRILVGVGIDLEVRDKEQRKPLHYACKKGHIDTVRFLVESGCKLDVCDKRKMTPLHYASLEGHGDVVEFLVTLNCELNVRDTFKRTPLYYAVRECYLGIVMTLLQAGSRLDRTDENTTRLLFSAVRDGNLAVVERIVALGCAVGACNEHDKTPLHCAVEKGRLDVARFLAEAGSELDARDANDMTPLHYAADKGHADAARFLVEAGCTADARDEYGMTPLHYAAENGFADIATLLARAGSERDLRDTNGMTPLLYGAEKGHSDIVQGLIAAGCSAQACDGSGMSPLHYAAMQGYHRTVRVLLDANCNLDIGDKSNMTPLHYAAREGHMDCVKLLVESGGKVNVWDNYNVTPLHYAIRNGHYECGKLLVEAGSNLEGSDTFTDVFLASREGHPEILRLLLDKGHDVDARDKYKRIPLHYAVREGHLDCVRLLVEAGSKVDVCDRHNWTPMHYATEKGHLEIVRFLVQASCRVEAFDESKRTPLHYAAMNGHHGTAAFLIAAGCKTDRRDKTLFTALHFAAENGHVETVRVLVGAGSNVDLCTQKHLSALHFACQSGRADIARLLVEAGCQVDEVDEYFVSPLDCAAIGQHHDIVRLLVEAGCAVPLSSRGAVKKAYAAVGRFWEEGKPEYGYIRKSNTSSDNGHEYSDTVEDDIYEYCGVPERWSEHVYQNIS